MVVFRPKTPGILVGKEQKDVYAAISFQGRRHPCRDAEADPHGPDCSADHRDSAVAVRCQVIDGPGEWRMLVLRCWL